MFVVYARCHATLGLMFVTLYDICVVTLCTLCTTCCVHSHFVYTFVYTFGTLYRSGTMLCTLTCRMYTLCVHTLVDLLHSCTWHLHNVWQTCSTTCIHSLDLLHFVYTFFMCTCMLPCEMSCHARCHTCTTCS